MRNFNEADKQKKSKRIRIQENPDNLPTDVFARLEGVVKESLRDGYLPCPTGWKIAKEAKVSKIAVGEIADRLGVRITNCQIGCFKVDKTLYADPIHKIEDSEVIALLETLKASDQLDCAKVFDLARRFQLKPIDIGNEASSRNLKVRGCQLGCF